MEKITDDTTTTTKLWNYGRKIFGQILLTTATIGISVTATGAGLQL